MGKQVQVVRVDTGRTEIKGKDTDQIIIVLKNVERGTEKKEFIPSFNKLYSAAAVLNPGDICDATWEKKTVNGKDYFNLTQLTKTGSAGSESISQASPKVSVIPSGGNKGPYKEDPDKQLSIARQNVNNVAMNFVIGMMNGGLYGKKATPDLLFEEVKRFAKKFEAYVTLKDDYGQLDGVAAIIQPSDAELDGMLD